MLAGAIARPDLIRDENRKPGTTDWRLQNVRIDPKTQYRCPWVEGYCSRTSLRAGEMLRVMVSTNPASPFVLDLYRLGYYGGKGGRHLCDWARSRAKVQPDPPVGIERLRECRWEPAVEFPIPADWPSGVYVGKLTAERGRFPELRDLHRPRRPCLRFPVPMQRHDLVGVQPLARPVVALRRRARTSGNRPEDPRELGPSVRQVLPGGR